MIFLKYWQPIVSAILTAVVAFGLHSLAIGFTQAHHDRELLEQRRNLEEKCAEDKAFLQKAGENYESKISVLNSRIRALSRVRPTCIMPVTPGLNVATEGNQGFPIGNGISSEWLIQFAGRCEREAIKLDSLQEFISK